ncbi:hypothetical protein ACHAXA_005801, partial [Cyclostephanos tholiformis]
SSCLGRRPLSPPLWHQVPAASLSNITSSRHQSGRVSGILRRPMANKRRWRLFHGPIIPSDTSSAGAPCTGTPLVLRATKSWYRRISLPAWTPPNSVFGPVWTTLYGLMGLSISRITKSGGPTA